MASLISSCTYIAQLSSPYRLIISSHRLQSITGTTMSPHEILKVPLPQHNLYQLLNIRNGLLRAFLKRTRIGDDVTYNLEFKLPSISEHLHLLINPEALDICSSKQAPAKVPIHHDAAAYSKIHQAPLQPKKRRVKWTAEEDATLLQMRNDRCSW